MTWEFDAGYLVLDFINTLEWRNRRTPEETIHTFEDFLSWARQGNLLDGDDIEQIASEYKGKPKVANLNLRRVLEIRETLDRIFSDVANGSFPADDDLEILNNSIAASMSHTKLEWGGDRFAWGWRSEKDLVDKLIWVITQDAVDLLTSDLFDRVGECADDRGCGYLFIDTSKNRSRKWCSMEACGNRAKARKHYQRTRK